MMSTVEPSDRTAILFGYLDEDDDGQFGNDNERTNLFDAFDYNGTFAEQIKCISDYVTLIFIDWI